MGRTRPIQRKTNFKDVRKRYLIICEGEKSEPSYFAAIRQQLRIPIEISGDGKNTLSLVNEAIRVNKEEKFDEVWCVFDRDDFPAHNFNEAIALARRHGFRVAYSNESFELWFVLHFQYLDTAQNRDYLCKMVGKAIGFKYIKGDEKFFDLLWAQEQNAINNSRRLLAAHAVSSPESNNPSTTVHELIEELRRNAP